MQKLFLLTALLIFCISALLLSQDNDTPAAQPTSRIEVHARSCYPPPYPNGLVVTLNSLAFLDNDSLYGWIIPYAQKEKLTLEETFLIDDSLGNMARDVLTWYKLRYGNNTSTGGRLDLPNEYNEYMISEGITDSAGYYVFENVPVGIYQIRCGFTPANPARVLSEARDTSQNLSSEEKTDILRESLAEQNRNKSHAPCKFGVTNFIQVTPDSIAAVKVYMFRAHNSLSLPNVQSRNKYK